MYRGLDKKSIEEYVRIADMISNTIIKELTRESVFDPTMIQALDIVASTIQKKKCVVYGGTALNAILPSHLQFYDPEYDLPDWDFFTDNPVMIAVDIADKVKAKTGSDESVSTAAHEGTYKVFADGKAIADITYVPTKVLKLLREKSVIKDGIHYSGPEYLRMSAYLELSRPLGQPDRWEKVIKRISLLNQAYPILIPKKDHQVEDNVRKDKQQLLKVLMDIQDTETLRENGDGSVFAFVGPEIISVVRRILQKRTTKNDTRIHIGSTPGGIMLMSPSPERTADLIVDALGDGGSGEGTKKFRIVKREGSGEFLGEQYVIYSGSSKKSGRELCTIIGVHDACQSIYTIKVKHQKTLHKVRIGSVESMLYVYNALLFAKDQGSFNPHEILRSVDSLIKLHIRVLTLQKKPILPLPLECIGKQETLKDIRESKRVDIQKILAERGRTSVEYIRRNIRYDGGDKNMRRIIERAFEREKEQS
jgi:hypothetical protein